MSWLPSLQPKRFSLKHRGEVCLNCAHALDISDRFCPSCGQRNSTKKINLKDLIEELFSSFFSYDSKLWRSLKLLFVKPGALPLAFVNGKRNQFTNPFRFFLSIAIIFFLVISLSIKEEDFEKLNFFGDEVTVEENDTKETTISPFIDGLKSGVDNEDIGTQEGNKAKTKTVYFLDSIQKNIDDKNSSIVETQFNDDKSEALQKAFKENNYLKFEEAIESGILEDNFLDWCMYRFFRGLMKTQQSVPSFLSFLLAKIPFFIFFFVPLFSIGYLVLFAGSGKKYVDHMVFNFNLSSFLLIIFALSLIVESYWDNGWFKLIFYLGIFFYTYKSIRNFYGHGRIVSFLKCAIIAFSYPISLFIFLMGLTVLSFAFY